MTALPIEATWLDAFVQVLERCKVASSESVVVLSEAQTRPELITLTELALARLGHTYYTMVLPTPSHPSGPLVRSSGASLALDNNAAAVSALCATDVIVDLTIEGLMHAAQTPAILHSGSRIMNISNEHPEALSRLVPQAANKDVVKNAVQKIRAAKWMSVESAAGTNLQVSLADARTVGIWGWTDRPGTLAHWPGGLVVSFPAAGSVNGQITLAPGDLNLSFKRYIESPVVMTVENDYVTKLEGEGADAALMNAYLAAFEDKSAYATSHVGWGLNPAARYEAMTLYDRADTNGTELRAVAGNFLYSTGANEFAGRFTRGHFDLPVMGCTIALDGDVVVRDGNPVA